MAGSLFVDYEPLWLLGWLVMLFSCLPLGVDSSGAVPAYPPRGTEDVVEGNSEINKQKSHTQRQAAAEDQCPDVCTSN